MFAMFMWLCVDVMVMSSVYVVLLVLVELLESSEVYMLNNVGDRMPPCGTPVLN